MARGGGAGIEALGAAGMGVGFHALRHRILPPMPDDELDVELTNRREEIEAVLGRRLVSFGYGKGDRRTAEKVSRRVRGGVYEPPPARRARRRRFLLERWEPGPLGVDDLLVGGDPARPRSASMTRPEVSVIVPTRNRSRRLGVALRTALEQDDVDLEVVVVDDGSTDDIATASAMSRRAGVRRFASYV